MSRIYRWHPQLKASSDGPMVGRSALHLQQSDIDGACGMHCALMALMLFGIVKRIELIDLSHARKKPLAELWRRTADYYFVGSKPRQLQSAFGPYKKSVSCRVLRKKNRAAQTLNTLQMDGVCIIGINTKDFSHWVLAIGTGGKEGIDTLDAETLLILDPEIPPIPLLPWNATLSVKASRSGRYRYETPLGSTPVAIGAVLALMPSITELDLALDREIDL